MELRDYQHQAIHDLRAAVASGCQSPLLVMPTGSGKTLVASSLIRGASQKRKRTLFLAPRRELVFQTSDKLDKLGVPHGIIMAGIEPSMAPDVQIASVHTLYRRGFKNGEAVETSMFGRGTPLPPADLIVLDEAHTNFDGMVRKILAQYPDAVRIGMTATPARSDGRGLGELYDRIIPGPSVKWLTKNGYLVPARYFSPTKVDLEKVKIKFGDYDEKELAERMNQPQLIGDVIDNWLRICPDRQTVVFSVNRAHALALYQAFSAAGVATGYLDGETEHDERSRLLEALERGDIRVLCSVDVLSYGWDCPVASCAVIARPTKSTARYLQVAGRVLRPAPGKEDCIIIDHGGVVEKLGFIDDDHEWSLDEGSTVEDRETKKKQRKEPKSLECPKCKATIRPAPECGECGHDLRFVRAKAIEAHEAKLQEIRRKEMAAERKQWSVRDKTVFYEELLSIARISMYRDGWAAHKYREYFGKWPLKNHNDSFNAPQPNDEKIQETAQAWVKHLRIKYAKSKATA